MGPILFRQSFLFLSLLFLLIVSRTSGAADLIASKYRGAPRHGRHDIPGLYVQLRRNYYKQSCPQVEYVIRVVENYIRDDETLAPSLLRMHFHDCFVKGCEASVLLNSSVQNKAEKDAPPNLTLRGFFVIDAVKAEIEKRCPATVSCADILAIVARDSVNLLGGPYYQVPTGRRDGFTSVAADALVALPRPSANFSFLRTTFQNVGLSVNDLVVLSGGHTIGFSHCTSIITRLYNFTGHGDSDPSLDPAYAAKLKEKCKPGDTVTKIPIDEHSELSFDTHYFSEVRKNRGLFQSDAALLTSPVSKSFVARESSQGRKRSPFFQNFPKSMVAMGNIGVLTRRQGEIRLNCAVRNS